MRGQEELERFVAEYSERGYQFAYSLCGNGEEAKELVQESFCRVFRNWGQYDRAQSMEGWFLGILRNVYVDSVRRYERRCGVSLDAVLDPGREESASLAESLADSREEAVLDRLSRESLGEQVRAALDSLRAEYRAVLTLCDMEGMGYEDIAEVLGCPLGTVRSRINRARAALKKVLLETIGEEAAHGL